MSFHSMLTHTCTIRLKTMGAATNASYGAGVPAFTDYVVDRRCLYQPSSGREVVNQLVAGVPIQTGTVFMEYDAALAQVRVAPGSYSIINVKDRGGSVLAEGPFDISHIGNAGGQQHHLEIVVTWRPRAETT